MSPRLKKFLQGWIINTFAVAVAAFALQPRINYTTYTDLLVASLILGILNAFLRPILMLMALPLLVFTLGLFILVINAVLLWFVGQISPEHFVVKGFSSAFWGALIIGAVSLILNSLTRSGNSRIQVRRGNRPPGSDAGGDGPVIDV